MTATVSGVLRQGKLELLEEPQGLREGRVRVTIEEVQLDGGATTTDRRAFLKLPLSERRRILSEQADKLASHYNGDNEWREWLSGDIVEY